MVTCKSTALGSSRAEQWVKDPEFCSCGASYNCHVGWIPGSGTSICCRHDWKKKKKKSTALEEEHLVHRKLCFRSSVTWYKSPLPSEPPFPICEMGRASLPGPSGSDLLLVGRRYAAKVRAFHLESPKQKEQCLFCQTHWALLRIQ